MNKSPLAPLFQRGEEETAIFQSSEEGWGRHSRESGNPSVATRWHRQENWMPAFASMTDRDSSGPLLWQRRVREDFGAEVAG
jgi:hypothetical protein